MKKIISILLLAANLLHAQTSTVKNLPKTTTGTTADYLIKDKSDGSRTEIITIANFKNILGIPTVAGTTNYLPKFTAPTTLGNSLIHDNGTSVSIGNASPTASTAFEINSTTGALIFPRMTTAQKNALTAINGMVLYDSSLPTFTGYAAGAWYSFVGNTGTTTANQYVKSSASNIITDALLKDSVDYVTSGSSGFTTRRFKYVDGNQGSAKVLTSDASGNASWVAAASTLTGATGDLISFSATDTKSNISAVAGDSYLRSAGTSTLPVWSTLKLPNSATIYNIPYATSANTWGENAGFIFNPTSNETVDINIAAPSYTVIRIKNAATTRFSGFFADNNVGTYQSYAGLTVSNSARAGNQFGSAVANKGSLISGGASSLGLNIGTITAAPLIIGTNDVARATISSAGLCTWSSAYHVLSAGTATAGTAPLKFTSGTLNTTAEVGAVEFLTDKFYGTITTGTARKEFTLNNAALTSGTVPCATTNGRLTNSVMTSDGTNIKVPDSPGDINFSTAGTGISGSSVTEGMIEFNNGATGMGGVILSTDGGVGAESYMYLRPNTIEMFIGGTPRISISANGTYLSGDNAYGVGISTAATDDILTIAAGTTTRAATKYLPGTQGGMLTTPEALTKEVDDNTFYQTNLALNRFVEGGKIADFYTAVNNTNTTETDLFTYTTKANTLYDIGEDIVFTCTGSLNDVTATAQIQFYFAGTNVGNTGALTVNSTGAWVATLKIKRTGASTATSSLNLSTPGASTASYTNSTDLTGLTFSGTNIIKVTGTAGGASGGSNDITAKIGDIFWWGRSFN